MGICGIFIAASLSAQDAVSKFLFGPRRYAAREVLEAFATSYPGRFAAPELRPVDGGVLGEIDWYLALDGVRFRWAGGRLLPEGGPYRLADFTAQPFYYYPEDLPAERSLSADERARLEAMVVEREQKPPERLPAFLDRLWGASDEKEAWALMKSMRFFGKEIFAHRNLLEEFAAVEAEILEYASRDPEIASWIEGVGSASVYLWRDIAGTRSRSYHSYGAAIDLVPAGASAKAWYWRSLPDNGPRWYEMPYEGRFAVPREVVAAFERRGFIWGGKWALWDQVHFEYRPELLALNGKPPIVQPSLPAPPSPADP